MKRTTIVAAGLVAMSACTATGPAATQPPDTPAPTTRFVTTQPDPTSASTPGRPWWNDRVFYEVFVRSFSDSDGDGVGDLAGLTAKLDYLNDGDPETGDDLGITGIWLMPIFEAASYHGYDVRDYLAIEDDYGTLEDFRRFLDAAHDRGIAVILDLVVNHTSTDHPWFQDAYIRGEKEDWYVWRGEPGDGWHDVGGRSYFGLFWSGMPDLNLRNPDTTAAVVDVAQFWVGQGVDGFRLDAAKHLIERGNQVEHTPETIDWLVGFHDAVHDADADVLLVGEIWSTTSTVARYVPAAVDMGFEFDLAAITLRAINAESDVLLREVRKVVDRSYPEGQFATFLTNHDQDRVMSQLIGDLPGAKLAAGLLLTGPGVPFLYYGEEVGMMGEGPDELKRRPFPWDSTQRGGFTDGEPWQPLAAEGVNGGNVADQTVDPESLLNTYRTLIDLRRRHPALRYGDLQVLDTGDKRIHAYLRTDARSAILVVANLARRDVSDIAVSLPDRYTVATLLYGPEVTQPSGDVYSPRRVMSGRELLVIGLS